MKTEPITSPVKEKDTNKFNEVSEKVKDKKNAKVNALSEHRKDEKKKVINGDHFSEKVTVNEKLNDSEIVENNINKFESEETNKEEKIEVDVDDDRSRSSPESQIQMEHSYSLPRERDPSSSNSPASETEMRKKQEVFTRDHDYSSKAKSPLTPKLDDNRYGKSSTKDIKKSSEKLISHLLDTYLKPEKKVQLTRYKERDLIGEMTVLYEFLTKGEFTFLLESKYEDRRESKELVRIALALMYVI